MLKGEKTILRPLKIEDLEKTLTWRNDIEIKNSALLHPFPISDKLEEDWYVKKILKPKDNDLIIFGIVCAVSMNLIGYTKIYNINSVHSYAYFGIIIGEKSARGKGIGNQATKLMIDYAFNTLNLRKLLLEVADFNDKAKRIYSKLGFNIEGTLKDQVYIDGKYKDVLIMSVFKNK